ncbi:hypothetical protein [Mucilaginibacter ginsenosidivorax]|uniref:Uncharacterized protein n=1 Tax=Mucilaginibacter ginsenosidivorax TaxID=862126 RepID=A0A5B8VXD9_9SPHI|nr:hypothetical protein [Mucilaginibacter ginsenosidivorax]QEC75983.1 hypothetical protein FSB76_08500 [Mucilaginibacter ginsenosidivorax]
MKIRLNYWQLILLFLPAIIASQMSNIPHSFWQAYGVIKTISNLLFAVNPCFIVGYQAYLVTSFNKTINGAKWVTVNALVPVVFLIAHFIYIVWSTDLKPVHLHNAIGPMEQADFGFVSKVITVFLVHAAVTFFLVNNIYVSRQIKNISDDGTKNQLNQDFMKPMKRLSNISYIALAGLLIIAAIADIMINGFVPKQD